MNFALPMQKNKLQKLTFAAVTLVYNVGQIFHQRLSNQISYCISNSKADCVLIYGGGFAKETGTILLHCKYTFATGGKFTQFNGFLTKETF